MEINYKKHALYILFFALFNQLQASSNGIDFINKTGESITLEYYLAGDEIHYKTVTLEPGQTLKAADNPNGAPQNITRVYRIWYNDKGGKEWPYIGGGVNLGTAIGAGAIFAGPILGTAAALGSEGGNNEKIYEKMCITKDVSGYHALVCYDDYK